MRAYDFRKVYADLVTPAGDVVVVYLNEVHLAGVRSTRSSAERYGPDGARTVFHGVADLPPLTPETALGSLVVPLAHGRITMTLEVEHGAWQPSTPSPVDPLHWWVLAARTRATLTWPDGRVDEGVGYVDWVEITTPTRLLGFRELWWGRAHLPDRTVVFEGLDRGDAPGWWVAAEVDAGGPTERPPRLGLDERGAGPVTLGGRTLILTPERVLHDGDAFDPERIPRWLDRQACQAFGGPTWETRRFGRARLGDAEGPALWERVRFGEAATATRR